MSDYLIWQKKKITEEAEAVQAYKEGFLFARTGKGEMYQTRSLRIRLADFELTSENRRVLSKLSELNTEEIDLPIAQDDYDWQIHKLAKSFYAEKFGANIFSASKVRQLLTTAEESNFNLLLQYKIENKIAGYAITYRGENFLHYAYPFYKFREFPANLGMGMMISAAVLAKNKGYEYFYIGSISKPADRYKLQFNPLEWFTGENWSENLEELKQLIHPEEELRQDNL